MEAKASWFRTGVLTSGFFDTSALSRYVAPVNPAIFPHLTVVLLAIGLFFTAWFFVYEVTSTKYTKDLKKELLVSLVAAGFMGFGSLFLMLWTNEPDKLYSMVELEMKGHDPAVLKSYEDFTLMAAENLGITMKDKWVPDKRRILLSLLKSVHIYKKHQVQYEFRTHFRVVRFEKLTGSTADTFLEYIERNLPEGVLMQVTTEMAFVMNWRSWLKVLNGRRYVHAYRSLPAEPLKERSHLLSKLTGVSASKMLMCMQEHALLRQVPKSHLVAVTDILKSHGVEGDDVLEEPRILTMFPLLLENYFQCFKDIGVNKPGLQLVRRYPYLSRMRLSHLKAIGVVPGEDLVHRILNSVDPDRTVKGLAEMVTGTVPSNYWTEWTLQDICGRVQLALLNKHWAVEIEKAFEIIKGQLRLKNKSLTHFRENMDIAQHLFQLPVSKVLTNAYVLSGHPANMRRIAQLETIGANPTKEVIRKVPKLLLCPVENLVAIDELLLKECHFSPYAVQGVTDVYTLSPETVRERLKQLNTVPHFEALKDHPRVLRLVMYQNKAKTRLAHIESMHVGGIISLDLLAASTKKYESFMESSKMPRVRGKDLTHLVSTLLEIENDFVRDELHKHPCWKQTSLVQVKGTVTYLLAEGFTREKIMNALQIVLYSRKSVARILEQLPLKPELEPFELLWKNHDHVLQLALYYLEKDYNFSGKKLFELKMFTNRKLFGKDLSAYDDLDVDELLDKLTPEEINILAKEVDPDDQLLPPSQRHSYMCDKNPTGPLNRKQLINHINKEALETPDVPELVPYHPGTVRGKKWIAPSMPPSKQEEDVRIDLGEDFETALANAGDDELVDLAAILGFHSMMNQDQYHASQQNSGQPVGLGWTGVTKATQYKPLKFEPPNMTDVEDSIRRVSIDDASLRELNLNNIKARIHLTISDEKFVRLFDALKTNTRLEALSLANTDLRDRVVSKLCDALEKNSTLRVLNVESNFITPSAIRDLIKSLLVQKSLEEFRAVNQKPSVLGNKIESEITKLVEKNPTLLRLGLFLEYNDAQNRISAHLQKNCDKYRLKRIGRAARNYLGGVLRDKFRIPPSVLQERRDSLKNAVGEDED
ncbi:unnamed protein product [Notodromas monacha]|uniref:Small ribosomal subunit protein uS10 domain-containing protein n=1 Tax=Notodromas monacha TaxID=399045 RepID=A0A7R9BMV3_9CRUS|nr:unnamed protein product [Notodromas monacha]CAG0917604.1 unnamed protein product [Notodromas monacha]